MDHTDPVRAVNPNAGIGGIFEFVVMNGGGWIPPAGSGLFNTRLLALLAGKTPKWIDDIVKEHKIPFRASGKEGGGEKFIDPADLARFVPFYNDPKKRKD